MNATATAKLMSQIEEVLKETDIKTVESIIASIPLRREALAAVDRKKYTGTYASSDYAYAQLAAVGGKGWRELLRSSNATIVNTIHRKEADKAAARNIKILASLTKAGVEEITGFESCRTSDGFQGRWTVETDQGLKSVFIDVICAGGYNIQCFHTRVLVKVV